MCILLVTGIEGAQNCASAMATQLDMTVVIAETRTAAGAALRRKEYAAIVVDSASTGQDPAVVDLVWNRAGSAVPIEVSFASTGVARLVREVRKALKQREREKTSARLAAAEAWESDFRIAAGSLVLNSQIALSKAEEKGLVDNRVRAVADLANTLRQQLSAHETQTIGPGRTRRTTLLLNL